MRKLGLMAAVLLMSGGTLPVFAADADQILTGGGKALGGTLTVSGNGVRHGDGDWSGKINYNYKPDRVHVVADVRCGTSNGTQATIAGPDRDNAEQWWVLRVDDSGKSDNPDRFSVHGPMSSSQAATHCTTPGGGGVALEKGNFVVHDA